MAQSESTTVIGASIVINGEFKSQEDVSIRGKIQGRIETTADLFVEEGGTVEAEVSTRNIDVRGTVIGNVNASDRFELHPEGSLTGDIRAPRVVVADGGHYKGRVDMEGGPVTRSPQESTPKEVRPVLRRR